MHVMDPLIRPDVLAYAEAHTTAPPAHLAAVDESTRRDQVGGMSGTPVHLMLPSP